MRVTKKDWAAIKSRKMRFKTTLLDLLSRLIDRTRSDDDALATMRRIFDRHDARLARTLAPLRLVVTGSSRRQHQRPMVKARSRWA